MEFLVAFSEEETQDCVLGCEQKYGRELSEGHKTYINWFRGMRNEGTRSTRLLCSDSPQLGNEGICISLLSRNILAVNILREKTSTQ